MTEVYSCKGRKLFTEVKIPERKGDYIYIIRLPKKGDEKGKIIKIGTTNNVLRRMKSHINYYDTDIVIEWISPPLSKWTTLRIESNMIEKWKNFPLWRHIPNDRFYIDKNIKQLQIKIKKTYTIEIG